jgi:hypothetical protein
MLAIFLKRTTNFSFDTLFFWGGSLSASFSLPTKLCGASLAHLFEFKNLQAQLKK